MEGVDDTERLAPVWEEIVEREDEGGSTLENRKRIIRRKGMLNA